MISFKVYLESKEMSPGLAYLNSDPGKRDPELEAIIMKSPNWACDYARYILKDRWLEAEPIIMSDGYQGSEYIENVYPGFKKVARLGGTFKEILSVPTLKDFFERFESTGLAGPMLAVIENPKDPDLLRQLFLIAPGPLKKLLLRYDP